MSVLDVKNKSDHTKAKMFLDSNGGLGMQRFDILKYKQFDNLTDKQLGFFWRPEEVEETTEETTEEAVAVNESAEFSDMKHFMQRLNG